MIKFKIIMVKISSICINTLIWQENIFASHKYHGVVTGMRLNLTEQAIVGIKHYFRLHPMIERSRTSSKVLCRNKQAINLLTNNVTINII